MVDEPSPLVSNENAKEEPTFLQAGNLRRYLKTSSIRWGFASSNASDLNIYLQVHSGEKPNKCNQCKYAFSQAGNLRTHLITHSGDKLHNCIQCEYMHSLIPVFWEHIWKYTLEKGHSNATGVNLYSLMLAIYRTKLFIRDLRRHLNTRIQEMQWMWLYILLCRQSEGTKDNADKRKHCGHLFDFSPVCVFKCLIRSPERRHICTGCIFFPLHVFLNVSSKCLC